MNKLRTVKIVIKETGLDGGKGFDVFLEGDLERLGTITNPDELSPAEWWGKALFNICGHYLKEAGAVRKDLSVPKEEGTH